MPITAYHQFTSPLPDGADTSLVKPSNWNAPHIMTVDLSGTEIIGAFSNGGNVTFGTNTAGYVTASAPSGGAGDGGNVIAVAGSTAGSTGTVVFSNSNNVTFGLNGGTVTANATFNQTVDSNKAGTGFTSTTTAGTAVVGTLNTNGLSIGVPTIVTNALTTAAQSNHSHNLATTTTNGSQIVIATTNSNGATMAVPPFITTFVNDLTSGRAGTGFTSTTTAGTAVVGTLNTNGLSLGVPAYITTFVNDLTSGRAGTGFTSTTTGGTAIVGTLNTNGLSIGVPTIVTNAITTARASNDGVGLNSAGSNITWTVNSSGISIDGRNYAGTATTFNGTNVSGSITQNSNGLRLDLSVGAGGAADGYNSVQFTNSTANSTMPLLWAGNSNGSGNVTVGLTGSTITMSAPTGGGGGAALQGSGTFTQNTGTVQFANSNGITFGLTAGQMTASHNGLTVQSVQTQPAGNIVGAGFTSTTTAGTAVVATQNSNGLSMGIPTIITNAITTARASNDGIGLNTAATNVTWTVNSGGISLNAGAYLTTARASNDAIGLNTALTANGLSVTANSSGLSINVPAWLTTAAQSNHSHGNPTLALTNITGTTASASNGLTLSLSGVAAQTVQTQPAGNIAGVGTTFGGTNVSATIGLNSNGLDLQLSAPTPGGGGAINVSAGTTSGNLQTIQFNNSNGVTFGLNGSTVTASVNAAGGAVAESNYFPYVDALWAAGQVGQNTVYVNPLANVPLVSYDRMAYGIQFSGATNSTMTVSATVGMGIYTLNGSTLSLLTSGSGSFSINGSGTANSTINSGPRWATMTFNAGGTFSGDVWIAFRSSTATAGVNATVSNLLGSRINSTWSGILGVGTAASVQSLPGMGYYSATSTALPNSMALSHITGVSSTAQRPQIFWLTNGAIPI